MRRCAAQCRMRAARPGGLNRGSHFCKFSALRREPPRLPLRRELSNCIKDLSSTTEGGITRGHCMHRGVDEHRVKKRSFILLLLISSVFAHTHCISLSHAVKSFGRDSSPNKGSRGVRCKAHTYQGGGAALAEQTAAPPLRPAQQTGIRGEVPRKTQKSRKEALSAAAERASCLQ